MNKSLLRRVRREREAAAPFFETDERVHDRRLKELFALGAWEKAKRVRVAAAPDMAAMSDAELLQIIGLDERGYEAMMQDPIRSYDAACAKLPADAPAIEILRVMEGTDD